MGYDMYLVENADDQEFIQAAQAAWNEAVDARDALPKEEQGTFRGAEAFQEGLYFDDPRAWTGQTERYTAAQAAVNQASDALDKARVSYFRLNIHGMGRYLGIMDALNMLQPTRREDRPEWPDAPERDSFYNELEALEEGGPDAEASAPADVVAFHKAHQEVLTWHPEIVLGMAEHKFGSNDDWRVTPEEIKAALETYHDTSAERIQAVLAAAGLGDDADYWLRWIGFLMLGAEHGGIRVR